MSYQYTDRNGQLRHNRKREIRAAFRAVFEFVTMRSHYRAKYHLLYLKRLANLVDYLDKDKALIVTGTLERRKINTENARVLICGDYISFANNLVRADASDATVLDVLNGSDIAITSNVFDGQTK